MLPEFSQYDPLTEEEKEFEAQVAQALRLGLLTQSGFDSLGVSPERIRKHAE